MKIKNIKNRKLVKSNDGVVGIVVALLLVGLFLSVLMIVQTTFIPNWMEQREAEHMEEVSNQFAKLKYAIDTQSLIGSFSNEKIQAMSSPITLGSKEYPILNSARSFGNLEIIPNSFSINITNMTNHYVNYSFGSIKFSSHNAYFIEQNYVYEAGAIIMEQERGNILTIEPSFDVDFNNQNITFNIPGLEVIGGKPSVSGYGTYPLRTEFNSSEINITSEIETITVYTNYPHAWARYFNNSLQDEDLEWDGQDREYEIRINENSVVVDLSFSNDQIPFNMILKISNIGVQLAPGWIDYL